MGLHGIGGLLTLGRPGTRGASAPAWTPADIEGLALWVKADAGLYKDAAKEVPATADGDLVYTWADQSGNDKDFVQATEAQRLVLKIVAGVNFIRSDGSNDQFVIKSMAAGATKTLFAVTKKNSAADVNYRVAVSLGSNATLYAKAVDGGEQQQWRWVGNQAGGLVQLGGICTDLTVWAFVFTDAATVTCYRDGSLAASFDPNDAYSISTWLALGSRGDGSSFFDGDFAEIILYNATLSAADRAKVEAYLAGRWTNPT